MLKWAHLNFRMILNLLYQAFTTSKIVDFLLFEYTTVLDTNSCGRWRVYAQMTTTKDELYAENSFFGSEAIKVSQKKKRKRHDFDQLILFNPERYVCDLQLYRL